MSALFARGKTTLAPGSETSATTGLRVRVSRESGKKDVMATRLIAFRFPNRTEFRTTEAPRVGVRLTHDDQEWVVVEVSTDGDLISVTLRPVEQTAEPDTGPPL